MRRLVKKRIINFFRLCGLFQNWLKGNHSLSRIRNPLSHAEAVQILKNAKCLGIKPLDVNPAGLAGLEKAGQWAGIPHFKVGNVHIPVQTGFTTTPPGKINEGSGVLPRLLKARTDRAKTEFLVALQACNVCDESKK